MFRRDVWLRVEGGANLAEAKHLRKRLIRIQIRLVMMLM